MTVAIKGDQVRFAIAWSLIFWGLFVAAVLAPQPWSAIAWTAAVAQVVGTGVWMLRSSDE